MVNPDFRIKQIHVLLSLLLPLPFLAHVTQTIMAGWTDINLYSKITVATESVGLTEIDVQYRTKILKVDPSTQFKGNTSHTAVYPL